MYTIYLDDCLFAASRDECIIRLKVNPYSNLTCFRDLPEGKERSTSVLPADTERE